MTPYVDLQESMISALRRVQDRNSDFLRHLAETYAGEETAPLADSDLAALYGCGLMLPTGYPDEEIRHDCLEILKQQLDASGEKIVIRNLLGSELLNVQPMDYPEFIRERGSGKNRLRTDRFSQPTALKKGDILASGDRLLSHPREGGNGAVLLHLTGGFHGHWISVPARIPIALLTLKDHAPTDLIGGE